MRVHLTAFVAVATMGFASAQSFMDSFENANYGANAPAGGTISSVINWTARNDSAPVGTTGWFNGDTTATHWPAHSGSQYIGADFNNVNSTGNEISNWLMSEVRTFTNGDTISFWTRTYSTVIFPDRLFLKLSTNGAATDAGSFSNTLVSVNPNLTTSDYPTAWTQFTATITGLGAPTSGRFAFHYSVTDAGPNGSNSDYIGIDDVAYSANPIPEPATIVALALGSALVARRRKR